MMINGYGGAALQRRAYLCVIIIQKTRDIMATVRFTSTAFRRKQAHALDLADKGNKVIIRRGRNQAYTITPISDDDTEITPELQAEIDQAREEYRRGETLHFENAAEMNAWLEA